MQYLRRALKSFIYYSLIVVLVIGLLVLFKLVPSGNVESLFRNGWTSVLQMAGVLAIFSALYPKIGFAKRQILSEREYESVKPLIINIMQRRGYELESDKGELLTFRIRSKFKALIDMLEDRVTLLKNGQGFEIEGLAKNVTLLRSVIEERLRQDEAGDSV